MHKSYNIVNNNDMDCTSETRFDIYQRTNRTHLIIIGPNLE